MFVCLQIFHSNKQTKKWHAFQPFQTRVTSYFIGRIVMMTSGHQRYQNRSWHFGEWIFLSKKLIENFCHQKVISIMINSHHDHHHNLIFIYEMYHYYYIIIINEEWMEKSQSKIESSKKYSFVSHDDGIYLFVIDIYDTLTLQEIIFHSEKSQLTLRWTFSHHSLNSVMSSIWTLWILPKIFWKKKKILYFNLT